MPATIRRFLAQLIRFVAVALTFLTLHTTLAFAHASLNATSPRDGAVVEEAPTSFVLTFSEPVSPLALNLIRPGGTTTELTGFEVKDKAVEIVAPTDLDRGTHVLTWRVVSADGHPVGGSVVFSVGEVSSAPPIIEDAGDKVVQAGLWLTKLAIYAGLFIGIGGVFAGAWLAPRSRPGIGIGATAVVLGIAGTILSVGLQGLDALGASIFRFFDLLMWTTGMGTSYGMTVLVMLMALLCALLALLATSLPLARLLSLASLVAGAGALALSGHASAAEPQLLMRPAVFLHAATITLWIGALVPLGLALRANSAEAIPALKRFSAFIPYAVTALVAAGMALTMIQVQDPAALLTTNYGRLLVAKLTLLVILFALAAYNRYRLTRPAEQGEDSARRSLVRSIVMETMLVLVILGIAAGWRFTPPPRSLAIAATQPAAVHIHTDKAMADVTITPGRAGPVSVSAVLMTGDFGPLDAKEVTFVFANAAAGIEAFQRNAEKPGDGTWRADGIVLPLPGTWALRIDILISDFEMTRIEADVEIRP